MAKEGVTHSHLCKALDYKQYFSAKTQGYDGLCIPSAQSIQTGKVTSIAPEGLSTQVRSQQRAEK